MLQTGYYDKVATLLGENRVNFKDARQWAYMVEDFITLFRVNKKFSPEIFRKKAIEVANAKRV